ncbi:MAG: hypothetical protein JF593_15375, partial [Novosphingobium sp.]|nr:hypothetical protein [Novosphingobium sp.]
YFGALWQGVKPYEWMPMMVTAIGGFELYLFAQEQWRRISGRGPGGPNG